MKILLTGLCVHLFFSLACVAQENDMFKAADYFLGLLDKKQRIQTMYPFDSSERYTWHFVPKDDRKGLSLNEMNAEQKAAAIKLMKTALSEQGYKKASAIMSLENVLKLIENRPENDHYRDPGKYFFTIFGMPSRKEVWGWRLEGHHLSFSFCSDSNRLVSGTPGFFGVNPAVVLSGPEKGLEILKEETELAIELLNSLNEDQLKKTIIDATAPADILTYNYRVAMIKKREGLSYGNMTKDQQKIFLQLLSIYIQRYTQLFAERMMKDAETAGLDNLLFAWAGSKENGPGHPKYYRIHGPTIIIEYDNTQNDGNHIHSVIRDLKNDFGGDALLEHYKHSH
ncbi:MAG: DUF3500 domain-containing protein [Ferruginibacter sp.]